MIGHTLGHIGGQRRRTALESPQVVLQLDDVAAMVKTDPLLHPTIGREGLCYLAEERACKYNVAYTSHSGFHTPKAVT